MFKILFLLLLFFTPLLAISEQTNTYVNVYTFDDQNSSYSIKDVVHKDSNIFVERLQKTDTKFHPNAIVWIKIDLVNNDAYSVEKVIKFLDIRLDRMDVYSKEGTLLNSIGDRVPFSARVYKDAQIAIDIRAETHTQNSVFIRFTNEDRSDLTYEVYDKTGYIEDISFKKSVHALFFGALIIMLVYNIVLYLFIREKTFLIYITYHTSLLVVMLYYNGLVSTYFYPNSYDVNGGNVPAMLSYLSVLLAIQFLRYFLNVKSHTPKIDQWLLAFIYVNSALLILTPIGIVPKNIAILNMMPLSVFLLYVASYHAFVLKRKLALFYLFGWLVMLIAIILTGLLSFGAIERNDFTTYIFQIGVVIEVTLLSMGLAYRYKINQDQLAEKSKVIHEQAKLASMGEMLQHISHQWRQPLSEINSVAMKIESDHRRKTTSDNSLDRNIEQIENLTEHMSKTIQDFNGYFKTDKKRVFTELKFVVEKTLGLVSSSLIKTGIKVEISSDNSDNIPVLEGELIQVLLVLLNNARDALVSSNREDKWIKIQIGKEGYKSFIAVEDSAGGIKTENIEKVFEPYFTTKFESQGVGIGLYMSKMIVEESMGGTLSVSNSTDGAKFKILF